MTASTVASVAAATRATTSRATATPVASHLTVPRGSLPRRPAQDLLHLARLGLDEAARAQRSADRYAGAHLAALRAAAALLAIRARPAAPGAPRRRPSSAWRLLASVAPEFGEWAAFFAAGAAKRAAAEAGVSAAVTTREADDLVRDAGCFLAAVGEAIDSPATLEFSPVTRVQAAGVQAAGVQAAGTRGGVG